MQRRAPAGTGGAARAAGAPSAPARAAPAEPKRMCTGKCRQYRVKKPGSGGRYEAGHGRCQTCDIWIDYRGGHMRNGRPATEDSIGWYCNCCNFRIRRNPRSAEYKRKMRRPPGAGRPREEAAKGEDVAAAVVAGMNLDYFNKQRAHMLRDLGRVLAGPEEDGDGPDMPPDLAEMLESEFEATVGDIVKLARSGSPNKVALVAEFERIRAASGEVPTRQEMRKYGSRFPLSAYDAEFESWGHLLERLGYDPWYRRRVG